MDDVSRCDPEHGCITCSDEGVPMRVVDVGADTGIATCVGADGARSEVLTGIIGSVTTGDIVLVHAGTALLRLDLHAGDAP